MVTLTVTKKFSFCYAHTLPGYPGKCVNMHGHNAELEVEVGYDPDRKAFDGMIIDFGTIKEVVNPIIERLDHHYLNEVLPAADAPPTCENLVQWLWYQIVSDSRIGESLVRLRLTETPTSWVEMRASD